MEVRVSSAFPVPSFSLSFTPPFLLSSRQRNSTTTTYSTPFTERTPFTEKIPLTEKMDLLRFTTAGSVDDGKSTLIGRLLYDSKSIFEDRYEQIEQASKNRGLNEVDLALLTDGLKAEREQGITIDVAYRYFATPRRKFIIADTPGHVQYTRNMVTGASTAELAVLLVDARAGVTTQTRRHAFIASLLQIPHIVVAINKMDLVDYDEEVYEEVVSDFRDFAGRLDVDDITVVPISALKGDNVVHQGDRMPWYDGPTLLHHLESVKVGAGRNRIDFRFPVQHVIRPHQDFRGYAGEVSSGSVAPGEDVTVLPSRQTTKLEKVTTYDGDVEEAEAGESVVLTTEDELDISRGDMIVRSRNLPTVGTEIDADLCWMNEEAMQQGKRYLLRHTSRTVQARIETLVYRFDIDTLHREEAADLSLNEIGRVEITTADPLFFDPYKLNRATGSFVLIDPDTNATLAAGMIRGEGQHVAAIGEDVAEQQTTELERTASPDVVWEGLNIKREEREERNGHRAAVVWLTGLSGSGKSTIARELERRLFEERGCQTMHLDGDLLRHGLSGDLGFEPEDRTENVRRTGETARLFFEQGGLVLCSFVSPYEKNRAFVRSLMPEGRFLEVFVDASVETCAERDPKGLYAKAEAGEIENFTGVSAPYEAPEAPALHLDTETQSPEECVEAVIALLEEEGLLSV